MDYIKDETVNSYNATIIEALNTPKKRMKWANKLTRSNFRVTEGVKFHGLTEYDKRGEATHEQATIYWTFTFKTEAVEGFYRYQTICISNYGHVDFSMHPVKIF